MSSSQSTHAPIAGLPLDSLVRPRSIALAGASEKPGSLGASVLANLESAGFSGDLYLVNPRRAQIQGRPCLASIENIPNDVDCVVLAIPSNAVLDAVEACARRRARSLIVFSAGFAETGEAGAQTQNQLAEIARNAGMAILGPNCLGLVNFVDRVPLTFIGTPVPNPLQHPGAAVLSQSGALAAVLSVNLRHHAVEIAYSISTGNESVCTVEDFVEFLLEDTYIRVFNLIVEQFRQPQRFLRLSERARELGKFIVLLHPGKSADARRSALTHTGAMARDYDVMRTKVEHAGVIVTDTLEELTDVTQILVRHPALPHGGAAIFAESGAFKAHAIDLCARVDLNLPVLSGPTFDALRNHLPDFIVPTNPLDLTAHALVDPELYARTLPVILGDAPFGSALLAIILTDEATCNLKLPPILSALRRLDCGKTVVFAAMDEGARLPQRYLDELRSLGVACFPSPERALRALALVTNASRSDLPRASGIDSRRPAPNLSGVMAEYQCKALLGRWGIPVPEGGLARTLEEAIAMAQRVGFPVALKAQSPQLPHKSDSGGVAIHIADERSLENAWERMHLELLRARPELVLDGVLVERMAPPGIELIAGARNDPDWGPVLLVGLGGVIAEAMNDRLLLPPDLTVDAIVSELVKLRCAPLLRGFRSSEPTDLPAFATIVSVVGELMMAAPSIREIDLNPIVVYPAGRGAVALDAVIVARDDTGSGIAQPS